LASGDALVLTYHSISARPGPTSIPVETFRDQMTALAEAGYTALTVDGFLNWRASGAGPDRKVLITFDDAFLDFRDAAHPILREHGFPAVVFAPTGKLGGDEAWGGGDSPGRPLMSWNDLDALTADGVEFGAHGVTHADLTAIPPQARREEIERSGAMLAERLGRPTRSFAAPYGHVNAAVLDDLAGRYEVAFGVRLDRARRNDPALDVPRIEMHYFRDAGRWRDFLAGANGYFQTRRLLRGVRETAERLRAVGGLRG
jgi:peptidoglycan/xylan/chitin deacetylase (PgdA/CDA1 family)